MATLLLRGGSISIFDYRCGAGPADKPFVELHDGFSVSYVRKGSFGYHARGASFELVAGSILVGYPGDEYMCTHEHGCGDECLSFVLAPSLVETIDAEIAMGRPDIWRTGCVSPLPSWWSWESSRRQPPRARAPSVSTKSESRSPPASSKSSQGENTRPRRLARVIGGAQSRRRFGLTSIRTSPLIWTVQRARSGSAPSTFCGSSRGCSG
jgi:hypothetical protein